MAVDLKKTWYSHVDSSPLAAGASVTEEGQAMVAVLEGGVEKVKPATGAANEKIAGFAVSRQQDYSTRALVEDVKVPAGGGIVNLDHGNLTVIRFEGASGGAEAPTTNMTTGAVTFDVLDAGKTVRVFYRYSMTVAEAKALYHQAPVNYPDANTAGVVGVGKGKGRVYTAWYDVAADWDAPGVVTVGANGTIAIGGTGSPVPGGRVVQVPTPNDPMLGIEFNV